MDCTVRDLPGFKEIIVLIFIDPIIFCVEITREFKDPSVYFFDPVPADYIVQKRPQRIPPDFSGSKVDILLFVIDLFPL